MKLTRIIPAFALVPLAGCGHVAELKPAKGEALPVKPLMARTTPTPQELLTIPTSAKPSRIDELVKRSQPRPQDPFDLPPPTGGSAPSLPPGSALSPAPANSGNGTPPAPGMPVVPPPTTPGD